MARVLIVDDSPTEMYKLTEMLEKHGHTVLRLGQVILGALALAPDLVGFLILGGDDDHRDVAGLGLPKGRIVGSDQFLTKPFSKEELLSAIKAYVPGFAAVEQAH